MRSPDFHQLRYHNQFDLKTYIVIIYTYVEYDYFLKIVSMKVTTSLMPVIIYLVRHFSKLWINEQSYRYTLLFYGIIISMNKWTPPYNTGHMKSL